MNTVNQEAMLYNHAINPQLMSICDTLFSCPHVKFSSFRYFRVFNDGSYLNLSTNCEWLNQRVTTIPDNGITFHSALRSAQYDCHTYYLWPNEPGNDSILNLFYKFDIWNGISVYRRKECSIEAWSFGSTRENRQQSNFYVNNLDYINYFISYFNSSAAHLIDPSDFSKLAHFNEALSIEHLERTLNSQRCGGVGNEEKESKINKNKNHELLNEKLLKKNEKFFLPFPFNNIYFTQKELIVLKLITLGHTIKEIGKKMDLSPRTIEDYLYTIKNKLNCNYKHEIANIVAKYNLLVELKLNWIFLSLPLL